VIQPHIEVADIFRDFGPAWRRGRALSLVSLKAMSAIERCRSSALGGHVLRCDQCTDVQIAYNSCRNRHCPKCQGSAAKRWLEERQAELLPVEYYHVVFTLPAMVADIAYQNPDLVYDLLFKVTAQTLRTIAADPKHLGARIGVTAVLHTWGSALTHHPHLHCIVPGGGLGPDGRWKPCKRGFFLPVRVLSRLFRRLFLEQLIALHSQLKFYGRLDHLADVQAFRSALDPARKTDWVVYARRPFRGPAAVLEYLSRYTHRVAISNSRIIDYDNHTVTFKWKDYRAKGHQRFKTMQLSTDEFIRRFLIHVLPSGFHRIRYFGLFANQQRKQNLQVIRQLLAEKNTTQSVQESPQPKEQQTKPSPFVCRTCGTSLVIIETLLPAYPPRGPPS
jgi:hypothetical protein